MERERQIENEQLLNQVEHYLVTEEYCIQRLNYRTTKTTLELHVSFLSLSILSDQYRSLPLTMRPTQHKPQTMLNAQSQHGYGVGVGCTNVSLSNATHLLALEDFVHLLIYSNAIECLKWACDAILRRPGFRQSNNRFTPNLARYGSHLVNWVMK